jgi:hypothetical protein
MVKRVSAAAGAVVHMAQVEAGSGCLEKVSMVVVIVM